MNVKKSLLGFFCSFFVLISAKAQHTEFSFHLSPHWLSGPKLDNSSPFVQVKDQFAGLGGLSYARFSRSGAGIRAGFNLGYILPRFIINRNPDDDASDRIHGSVVMYNSLSLEPVYRLKLSKWELELFGGADLRYFHSYGGTTYGYQFLSENPSEFNVFGISNYTLGNKFQSNLYGGLSFIKSINAANRISIGLIKNFGLSELDGGVLTAKSDNGNTFQSSFSNITDFTGIRVQYGYNIGNKGNQVIAVIDDLTRHSIFLEVLGSGGVGSINYDRRLKPGNNGFGIRAGLGLWEQFMHDQDGWERYVSIPLMVNYIIGKRRSGLEGGIGITPEVALKKPVDNARIKALGALNLGYRLQPLKSGFMLRAGWTPVFNRKDFDAAWAGISLGYSFKK